MSMKPLFSTEDMERWFDRFEERSYEKLFILLSAAGEKFVEIARKSGSYTDRTGNLRSSVGYVIYNNGEAISENFERVANGGKGLSNARQLANKVGSTQKNGMSLVCVAGMNYAAAVEAKGKDVITSGSIQCEDYLKKALKRTFDKM